MDETIAQLLSIFALFVGTVGVTIILVGVVRGLRDFLIIETHRHCKGMNHDRIRSNLGTYLLLGLEFLIAADILETVFKPTLEHLAILWGIVLIRTVLNYFLTKELEHIEKKVH